MWVGTMAAAGSKAGAICLELARPWLGDRQSDADDGHLTTLLTAWPGWAGATKPTRCHTSRNVASATSAACWRPCSSTATELRLVGQQLERPVAEGRHELDHDVGEVLLEVAVATPGVLLLEVGDAATR